MFNKEECQNIIKRLATIVDFDINIMDLQGKIIASTDEKRINEEHRGAKLCISQDKQIIIEEKELHLYPHCRSGINLPLYHNDMIIGALGIAGEPDELLKISYILKELVEHIVIENQNQQFKALQQEALRSFFVELFNSGYKSDYEVLVNRAKLLQFDYEQSRMLVLGKMDLEGTDYDGISYEILKKRGINTIRHCLDPEDISLVLYEDYFVIVLRWRANLESYLTRIINMVEDRLKVKVNLFVGGRCDHISDYGNRYHIAKKVADLSQTMNFPGGIHYAQKYELELLLGSLDESVKNDYLENYSILMKSYKEDKNTKELFETIKAYFECNMSIGETAQQLFIHRNTVGYRLNKFKETFKISINKTYDCMKIYLAIKMIDQIMIEDEEAEKL